MIKPFFLTTMICHGTHQSFNDRYFTLFYCRESESKDNMNGQKFLIVRATVVTVSYISPEMMSENMFLFMIYTNNGY